MSYVSPLDIVELMTDAEYETFKDALIRARAIDPKTQMVLSLDLYAVLQKTGVGLALFERYMTLTAVDSTVSVTNIEDLPNLVINNKAYLLTLKEPLALKRGGSLKLEVFTILTAHSLMSLGYVPTLTDRHTLETNSQISKLIKYLTTHHLTEPLSVSMHTRDVRMVVYFKNGHRLVPKDSERCDGKDYFLTLSNAVQTSVLTSVLLDSVMTTHAFPESGYFDGTVKQIGKALDVFGITYVQLIESKIV